MYEDNVQSVPQLKPSLHEEFSVGDRVIIDEGNLPEGFPRGGEIVGIAWSHVVFGYIVELDLPLLEVKEYPGKPWKCVCLIGSVLKKDKTTLEECDGEYCSMKSNGCHECDPEFFNFGDTKKLAETLKERNDEDYQKGDVHQSILNLGYEWWQRQGPDVEYKNMITLMQKEYGDLSAFAILIGKYNQQVCNGGHIQYFDNGYADGQNGFGRDHDLENPLHKKMLSFFESLGLNKSELGSKVFDIASRFEIEEEEQYDDYSCDHYDDEDDNEEEYCFDCEYENSYTELVVSDPGLDNEYYSVNDEWMKYLNEVFKKQLM